MTGSNQWLEALPLARTKELGDLIRNYLLCKRSLGRALNARLIFKFGRETAEVVEEDWTLMSAFAEYARVVWATQKM